MPKEDSVIEPVNTSFDDAQKSPFPKEDEPVTTMDKEQTMLSSPKNEQEYTSNEMIHTISVNTQPSHSLDEFQQTTPLLVHPLVEDNWERPIDETVDTTTVNSQQATPIVEVEHAAADNNEMLHWTQRTALNLIERNLGNIVQYNEEALAETAGKVFLLMINPVFAQDAADHRRCDFEVLFAGTTWFRLYRHLRYFPLISSIILQNRQNLLQPLNNQSGNISDISIFLTEEVSSLYMLLTNKLVCQFGVIKFKPYPVIYLILKKCNIKFFFSMVRKSIFPIDFFKGFRTYSGTLKARFAGIQEHFNYLTFNGRVRVCQGCGLCPNNRREYQFIKQQHAQVMSCCQICDGSLSQTVEELSDGIKSDFTEADFENFEDFEGLDDLDDPGTIY